MENNTVVRPPWEIYRRPVDIVNDTRLPADEKRRLLSVWEQDTRALSRAENENMQTSDAENPSTAAILQKIRAAKRLLK